MAKPPTMVATVHANTTRREVSVIVEHADNQSFSRAVEPKARKELKRWISEHIMFGDLHEVSHSLAWHRTHEGRCVSIIGFTY